MSSASDRATTKTRRTVGGMTIRIKVCIARGDLSAPNCLFCEMNWTNCCANTDERRWSPSTLGPGDEGASDAADTDTMVSSAVLVEGLWLLLCSLGGVMSRCCVYHNAPAPAQSCPTACLRRNSACFLPLLVTQKNCSYASTLLYIKFSTLSYQCRRYSFSVCTSNNGTPTHWDDSMPDVIRP
jgi:hypothetical protein